MKRVLIVEDEELSCRAMCLLLEKRQIAEATCVGSFGDALDKTSEEHFDSILVDLDLPDSGALNTLLHSRELGDSVIVMTGLDDPEILRQIARLKLPYLLKPIDERDFFKTLRTELEFQEPSRDQEVAILNDHKTLPAVPALAENTTNVSRVKRWIGSNAIPLVVALLVLMDHGGVVVDWIKGNARASLGLEQRMTDVERELKAETEARKEGERKMNEKLNEVLSDLGVIKQQNATSIAERGDLKKDVVDVKRTTAEIMNFLLNNPRK